MEKYNVVEEENKRNAIMEAINFYTVAVADVGEKGVWGTGTPIKFREKFYILTALHVIKNEPINENLRFIPKGDVPLLMVSKHNIFKYPTRGIAKSYAIKLPIINRIVSDEIDHLALLNLDSSVINIKSLNFYEIVKEDSKTPPIGTQVGMLGFSREIARKVGMLKPKVMGIGVLPYSDWSKIVDSKGKSLENFDKEKHFLVEFTETETSCDPRGLSGCGIWVHVNPGMIWNPNLRLVGVETHFYSRPQVLKATRIERVLDLLKNNY